MVHNALGTLKEVIFRPPTCCRLHPINVIAQHHLDHGGTGGLEVSLRKRADFVQAEGRPLHLDVIFNIDAEMSWIL